MTFEEFEKTITDEERQYYADFLNVCSPKFKSIHLHDYVKIRRKHKLKQKRKDVNK